MAIKSLSGDLAVRGGHAEEMAEEPTFRHWGFTLMLATSLAGGCASMSDMAGVPHAGHQPNGGYVLLAAEQQYNCRRLSEEVELGLKDMQVAKARIDAERAATPATMASLYGRMFGGADGGLRSAAAYQASEARVRSLNAELQSKGCHYIDVDARIMAFNLEPLDPANATGDPSQQGTSGLATASIPARDKASVTRASASSAMQAEMDELNRVKGR